MKNMLNEKCLIFTYSSEIICISSYATANFFLVEDIYL